MASDVVNVSVVIPCYNCADSIVRAVASVMNQTAMPFEIVLIDDGSTDETVSTLTFIQSHWRHQCNISIIKHQHNKGVAVARNTGWDAAVSNYIAFLDADDAWLPDKLFWQYAWMQGRPDVTLTCHGIARDQVVNNHSSSSHQIKPLFLLFKNKVLTSTVMIKRSISVRFNQGQRYSEDYQLWLQLAYEGSVLHYLDRPLTVSFKRPYGVSGLSKELKKMQLAELGNYHDLFRKGLIAMPIYCLACSFSIVKFFKRCLTSCL